MCVQIGSDHRQQCKTESKGRDRLDDADKPQAFAQGVDLPQEALSIAQQGVVTDHCVMQVADQACQHGLAVAEIDHHHGDCWKQHANDQNVLLHLTSRHGRDGGAGAWAIGHSSSDAHLGLICGVIRVGSWRHD